ncbi:unnamed protein product [Auanema sp. JU1783]|nr:unnamed protein product [Auanema sp. JU1783]
MTLQISESNTNGSANKRNKIDPLLVLGSFWPQATSERNLTWRIITIIRSAERVDRVFGNDWQRTEKPYGKPAPTDLNIDRNFIMFGSDVLKNNSPITWLGKKQVEAVARAMCNRGVNPETVYSSPALRSVQTASVIAKFFGISIKVEPGLIEEDMKEVNFHIDALKKVYPIDSTYSPLVSIESLKNEKSFDSRKRLRTTVEKLSLLPRKAPLLIVSHASTQHAACELAHFRETPATTNLSNSNEELSDSEKSFQMPRNLTVDSIELGLRYAFIRTMHGKIPACDYRLMPNLIPPMTYGHSITTQPIISSDKY